VQTGVIMVIYLEEAVARKREEVGTLTRKKLMEAVMEGALLRLRPKLMTVSTVVAGLLPIMWSTSAGSEVMKPLAMRVLGRDGLKSSARVNCHAGDLLTAAHRRRSEVC
jgi:Cu(I)/Ag(I) efflux system membrane protein CusA/SilA